MTITLDRFIKKEIKKEEEKIEKIKEEKEEEKEEVVEEEEEEETYEEEISEEIVEKSVFEAETPKNTGILYLLSVTYSGSKNKAVLKLYDPEKGKIVFWYDDTNHKPYLLTDIPMNELNQKISFHAGFEKLEEVEKYDLLHDKIIKMIKVIARDPLSIGGRKNSLREIIGRTWESNIRYHECYTYDSGLIPGYTYMIKDGKLIRIDPEIDFEKIKGIFKDFSEEKMKILQEFYPLFIASVPNYRRLAIDIEVLSESIDRIPDPSTAKNPIICVSLVSSDGLNKVLLLKRQNVIEGLKPKELPENIEIEYFDNEISLIKEVFKYLLEYPIVLTFNGDNFDLHYIWRRAQVLGIKKEEIPIIMGREIALLPIGIHIDLYKFFHNHAIQVYAFGNSYREITLDAIANTLIGITKIPVDKNIGELSYLELASYCYRDALITLNLTTFNSNLVMNLITMIMRISKMSMEDVVRQGISKWIKSMLFYEHRKKNYLIPNQEDIETMKGMASTTAIIKGKKYMGAIVIKPETNVYFNVIVLDFASLYPGIIAKWNLSYETVRCPHEECRSNLVPDTKHWVCKKRLGLMSLIIGILRDVRVKWFKHKAKDPSLSKEERSWYNVVQQALKVFLNASYGVFGSDVFQLYCLPLAESTTAIGRYIIKETINKAREMNLNVIYADTDSLFIHKPSEQQIIELQEWAESRFGIDLEVDKKYVFLTFSGRKKNYLGLLDNGIVDIKGLVGKKRNTPVFLKHAFNELIQILKEVKTPEDFNHAKEKIKEIVQNCYNNLKNRKYTLDELAFKVMLSRSPEKYVKTTPQHVKAARLLQEKGKEVKPGDIISYVKVQGGVKPVQLARLDEIDTEKYVGHIQTTFEQVLDALGIEFEEIVGVKKLEFFTR
jgi:DNA polymerase I